MWSETVLVCVRVARTTPHSFHHSHHGQRARPCLSWSRLVYACLGREGPRIGSALLHGSEASLCKVLLSPPPIAKVPHPRSTSRACSRPSGGCCLRIVIESTYVPIVVAVSGEWSESGREAPERDLDEGVPQDQTILRERLGALELPLELRGQRCIHRYTDQETGRSWRG